MPNIRMIWWDYGRVLFNNSGDELCDELTRIVKPELRPVEIYGSLKKSGLVNEYDLGNITTEQFVAEAQTLLGFTDKQAFVNIWRNILSINRFAWRAVSALRMAGYKQGAISNINEMHVYAIENILSSGAIMQLRPRIYSCRERVKKPDSEIFRIALERGNAIFCEGSAKLLPAECVFIDDLLENVEAAKALGWNAILHSPVFVTGTMLKLSELGVRV